MMPVWSKPSASSASRIAPMRPSIMSLGATMIRAGRSMRERRLREKFDRLIVQDMEMFAIHSRHAAMAVAHVFAETDIGDHDQLRTFRFDRADRFLNDSVLRVGAARLLIFFCWNTEEQHGLKPEIAGALRFVGYFFRRELENARHARDRAAVLRSFR